MSSVTANASYYTGGKDIDQHINNESMIQPSNSVVIPGDLIQ